jgi:predicted phage tail protein
VHRIKAADGANRDDDKIDLFGIYDVQAQLDAIDAGAGGEIGMALDQFQDVDTELATIAAAARAKVYRIGPKLHVTRDAPATASALFNSRNKTPEGESIAMRLTADTDYDAVVIPWIDVDAGYKQREYTYPTDSPAVNPMTVGPAAANWPQAYRRALYEWNRIVLRREVAQVTVMEEGGLLVPGQVINMTDDLTNLTQTAGEVIEVAGLRLRLDRPTPGVDTIMLRSLTATEVDVVGVTSVSADGLIVTLARAPAFPIKGRDSAEGTLFAAYTASASSVRQWIVNEAKKDGLTVALTLSNYDPAVYVGDTENIPAQPVLVP